MADMRLTGSNYWGMIELTGNRLICARHHDNDLIGMRDVERTPCQLVQHVLFQRSVVQKAHALFKMDAPRLDGIQLSLQLSRASLHPVFRIDAVLAMVGMETEIAEHDHAERRYDQLAGISLLVLTGPHEAISVMASCRPIVLNGRLRAGRNRLHATQFGHAWRAALADSWSPVGGRGGKRSPSEWSGRHSVPACPAPLRYG